MHVPDRGVTVGVDRPALAPGQTRSDLVKGYSTHENADVPPREISYGGSMGGSYPNPDRMVWDDDERDYVDGYKGGFVSRDPTVDEDRD